MKLSLTILILYLFLAILPARADYIATHTFVVDAENTITVIVSGTLSTAIDAETGSLGTGLNINFNIATNEDLENIRLKALVLASCSTKICAFCATDESGVCSKSVTLIMCNCVNMPDILSINDCKLPSPTSINNQNAIAYPGLVSINNDGNLSYSESNGYFSCAVKTGTTDLNITLNTSPKPGTFDAETAMDSDDNYEVEIFLDNIP